MIKPTRKVEKPSRLERTPSKVANNPLAINNSPKLSNREAIDLSVVNMGAKPSGGRSAMMGKVGRVYGRVGMSGH